jgi:hypothetical protein
LCGINQEKRALKKVFDPIEQDLREKSEENLEDEEAFENTEWEDFTEEDTYTKKKVNVALITHLGSHL